MFLNLIKLCVGVEDVAQLDRYQSRRLARGERLVHRTRMMPRRAEELLDGGSLYWVIRGRVRVRQRLLAIERIYDEEGRSFALLVLAPELVRTLPRPHRAFQGWRYFPASDAPPDIGTAPGDDPDLPPGLREALTKFGVLGG